MRFEWGNPSLACLLFHVKQTTRSAGGIGHRTKCGKPASNASILTGTAGTIRLGLKDNFMDANIECFGGCPYCGGYDVFLNIGRDHWIICRTHQVKWHIGSNLFSCWRNQTEEQWLRNTYELAGYPGTPFMVSGAGPRASRDAQPEGLGVCRTVLSYSDTDEGEAARDRFLESLNPESVTKIIAPMLALASGVVGGES